MADLIQSILKLLTNQFTEVMSNDPNLFDKYKIVLSNEQQFVKERHQEHNYIFLVVKFLEGTKDNGQLQQPILINAIGENNAVDVCQRLLHEYSQTYSVSYPAVDMDEFVIKQSYSTPMVMQNFNNVNDGYRSLFYMSGTFFVSSNVNLIKKISWLNDENIEEDIPFINASLHYAAQIDPRSQYGSNDFNKSTALIRTLSLNVSIYNTTSNFNKKVLSVMFGGSSVDTTFTFTITYKDENIGAKVVTMRLVNADDVQQLRAFPVRSLSFTQ